jgi:DNA (cytosine-5)-methyltransferase 1
VGGKFGLVGVSEGRKKLRAVDLFCGSGAVSAALRRQGFRIVAAVDNDPIACRTYKLNHPGTRLIQQDIRAIDPVATAEFQSLDAVDLLVVCAPCQPFSSQNRKRKGDVRAALILESIKFAAALKPELILFENVSGLAGPGNQELLSELQTGLLRHGYHLGTPRRIDAADLGVPQRRVRCVMVATTAKTKLTVFQEADFSAPRRTVRHAIGCLPPLSSGERSANDPLHFARDHQAIVLQRLSHIPRDGGSRAELPKHLELKCHVGRPTSYSDVYGRMSWNSVAPTLTTGCTDVTRGRFAHPDQDRAITLREAALLQTFPMNYKFYGSAADIAKQIGNAVPVAMVEAFLPTLKRLIEEAV